MKTIIPIQVQAFPVVIRDERAGDIKEDTIVLTRDQLRAAQIIGESSKEIIYRIYNRQGHKVLDIGKAVRCELTVDLGELYASHRGGEPVAE